MVNRKLFRESLIVALVLSIISVLTIPIVKTKPNFLVPGVYVEYRLLHAIACKEIISVDLDTLVKHGVLYKYVIGETALYTNVPEKDLNKVLKNSKIPIRGNVCIWISYKYGDPYVEVRKLAAKGILPLIQGKNVLSLRITLFEIIEAKYYWKCVGFKGKLAVIEAGFVGSVKDPSIGEEMFVNRTFSFFLDPESRVAYSLSGEKIGVVPYWTTISKLNEKITIFGLRDIVVNGTVCREEAVKTLLGVFSAYIIEVPATIRTPVLSYIAYDKNTGLLLKTYSYVDPVLEYFMDIAGICSGYVEISETNIIKQSLSTYTLAVVFSAVGAVFALSFTAVFLRKIKKTSI